MAEPWEIDCEITRRDFWLDEYFTYFSHPWVRYLMGLLPVAMCYAIVHKFLLTHSLTASILAPLPPSFIFWLVLAAHFLRMPPAGGVNKCSVSIDARQFCYAEKGKAHRYSWKQVAAISQTIEYTLFFTWKGGTFTLPNCAFGTFEEAQRFYSVAQQYKYAAKHGQRAAMLPDETVWPPAPRM